MQRSGFTSEQWDALAESFFTGDGVGGDAAYAAICLLVDAAKHLPTQPERLVRFVVEIELMRSSAEGTALPGWLMAPYDRALEQMTMLAVQQLISVIDKELLRSFLALIALRKGFSIYARSICEYTEQELGEFFLL